MLNTIYMFVYNVCLNNNECGAPVRATFKQQAQPTLHITLSTLFT